MIGKNILELRKNKKMSQDQLAEKINVTRQTISNWELGETTPNAEQLITLAEVFEVSMDRLVGRKEEGKKVKTKHQFFTKETALYGLVLICFIVAIVSIVLLFKEKDKNVIKYNLTTRPTTTIIKTSSRSKIDDTFVRTYQVLKLEKVICDSNLTGCDETTYKIILKRCNGEEYDFTISNFLDIKNVEVGKTYEFKFQPLLGEVYYEDNIKSIFAFNKVISVTETTKKCKNQIQDAIKTKSE